MSDAPKRIWAARSQNTDATMWWDENCFLGVEYVRADLLDAAVKAERSRCATKARLAMVDNPSADELTCSICAAAIRKEGQS